MKTVDIYTDGACSGNPGVGGYCAILIYNDVEKLISGNEQNTTNNRMELYAVIKGLECLKERCVVNLYSDSQYVVDAFNKDWILSWKTNNWKTSNKKEVKNQDLWIRLFLGVCTIIKLYPNIKHTRNSIITVLQKYENIVRETQ